MKVRMVAVSLCGAAMVLVPAAAAATGYPPSGSNECSDIKVSTQVPAAGQSVTVYGTNFTPSTVVPLVFKPMTSGRTAFTLPSQTTDAAGSFTFSFVVPKAAYNQGRYLVSASSGYVAGGVCPDDPYIQAPTVASASGTAMTGVDIALLGGAAAVLVLGGVLLVVGSRRRAGAH